MNGGSEPKVTAVLNSSTQLEEGRSPWEVLHSAGEEEVSKEKHPKTERASEPTGSQERMNPLTWHKQATRMVEEVKK